MINLVKGQKIDLTKGNAGLSNLLIGLGWDPIKRGGFFSSALDADASVFLVSGEGKLVETVYYAQESNRNGSVRHSGDNLTGGGDGDDEQITINLANIPSNIEKLVFVVNIYSAKSRRQHFGMVKNAYIHVANRDNNQELARFNLTDDYSGKTALVVGEIYRHNGEWKFAATGEATNAGSINELASNYR